MKTLNDIRRCIHDAEMRLRPLKSIEISPEIHDAIVQELGPYSLLPHESDGETIKKLFGLPVVVK
jgi:hypothetical protein